MRSRALPSTLVLVLGILAAVPLRAQLTPVSVDLGGNGLGLALRRLGVTGRVLCVTAHPDDEHNGVLVRLSRGLGQRTALLTLTRGEGGQNAIGPELGEALGVLRTEELLAVHRYDRVEQYFARAYEFGFSVNVEETLEKWGHDETLGDVVRAIRTFRPDVILTLPLDEPTHQHHSTSALLAREAFRAAALPDRFPEQVQSGLRPWQAARIYQGGVGGSAAAAGGSPIKLSTAAFDPLLGMSAQQFGVLARSAHRSQTARQMREDPGKGEATFLLVDREPKGDGPEAGILDGLDTTLSGLARFVKGEEAQAAFLAPDLARLEDALRSARDAYDARSPEKATEPLAQVLGAVRKTWDDVAQSRLSEAAREELLSRLDDQERYASEALALAQGLVIEARLAEGTVVPGQTLAVTLSIWNQGQAAVSVDDASVEVPGGWSASRKEGEVRAVEPGQSLRMRYDITAAASALPTGPYWKRQPQKERYAIDPAGAEGLPWSRPDVTASARVRVAGVALRLETPAVFRYEAAGGGEKQHVLEVVPALSVLVSPDVLVFPTGGPRAAKEVRVKVKSYAPGATTAAVRVLGPEGWQVEPKEVPVGLNRPGDEATARFYVTAPLGLRATSATLHAVAVREGREYGSFVQEIAYPHIQSRQRLVPAEARLLAFDVRTAPGVRVGYVMGSGGSGRRRDRGARTPADPAHRRRPGILGPRPVLHDRDRCPRLRDPARLAGPSPAAHEVGGGRRTPARAIPPCGFQRGPGDGARGSEQPLYAVARLRDFAPHHRRDRQARRARAREFRLHHPESPRPSRLDRLGSRARDPASRCPRPALCGAPRGGRPLPQEPRSAEGDPGREPGGQGHLDLHRARALPPAARGKPGGLSAAREPDQPTAATVTPQGAMGKTVVRVSASRPSLSVTRSS